MVRTVWGAVLGWSVCLLFVDQELGAEQAPAKCLSRTVYGGGTGITAQGSPDPVKVTISVDCQPAVGEKDEVRISELAQKFSY